MSYWRYWELDSAPFSSDSTHSLFHGATVDEALARIEFLVGNRRQLGLLIGPRGIGKSTILRHVANNPPHLESVPNIRCLYTSLLGLTKGELLDSLATTLMGSRHWFRSRGESGSAWSCLCDYFRAAAHEDVQTVLLLDDLESSTAEGEADLFRVLSMAFPLTVVAAVESELLESVRSAVLDRTELRVDLPHWEISQTVEFLAWSIARVGHSNPIFTDSAVERIQELSQGIPRRVIQLADLALVAGAVSAADCIDVESVEQVAFELPRSSAA